MTDKPPPFTSIVEEPAPATADKPMADPDWSPGGTAGADDDDRPEDAGKPRDQKEDGIPAETDIDREERDLSLRMVEAIALAYDPEPERKWIVPDTIPDENLTLVTGEGGIGKTTLMLQLAVEMRTDGYWLGMRVTQGPVIFFTSEDDRKDVHLNLRSVLKGDGKNLAHCPGLHIIPLADRDACLAAAQSKSAQIVATPLWHALVRIIERQKPRVVIFDALADLFGGEENARRHVRGFIVLLKQLAIRNKLAVILIAHPSLSGMNSGSGLSGSTDWHNGPRARLYFERPKDKEGNIPDEDLRTLTVKKVQYAREGAVFRLRRKAGYFAYESREGGSAPYDRAASASKAEIAFLSLLQSFEDLGRPISPSPGANYAPTVFSREEAAENITKIALERAMSRLLKSDRIHITTVGPPSKQRKNLVVGSAPDANNKNDEE